MSTPFTRLTDVLAGRANDSATRAVEQQSRKARVCRYFSGIGMFNPFSSQIFLLVRWALLCVCKVCCAAWSEGQVILHRYHERGEVLLLISNVEMAFPAALS
jgi:hypothetical protein